MKQFIYILMAAGIIYSQNTVATEFYLNGNKSYRGLSDGLKSNIVSEIKLQGDSRTGGHTSELPSH